MKRLLLAATVLAMVPSFAHGQTNYPPYYQVPGTPNSVQLQTIKTGLDLGDVTDESEARFGPSGDADTIGVAQTRWDSQFSNGDRTDAKYEKAWRPFEGSRARLLLDIPVSYVTVDHEHGSAVLGSVNLGLEVPVLPNWSITPRLAYGIGDGGAISSNGEIATASVASRYRVAQIGRGDLVIGDMIGYSSTLKTGINSQPFYQPVRNWAFRNGVAYQYPLETRLFGRQASVRVSYVNTQLTGDPVPYGHYNELAANLGVRLRESAAKTSSDLFRFGLMYTWADDYHAATVTLGYRF